MNSKLLNDYVELLKEHGQSENAEYFRRLIYEARNLQSNVIITPEDNYEIASEKFRKNIRDKNLAPTVGVWDSILRYGSEIEAVFKFDKIKLPFPVFCGIFPTGSFNSEAIRTSNGALLLINEGLFMLVHRAIRFMSYDKDFYNLIPSLIRNTDFFLEGLEQRKILSREEIIVNFTELLIFYLLYRDPLAAPKFPRQNNTSTKLVLALYTSAVEYFSLAHEFAHVHLGHLDDERIFEANTPLGLIKFCAKNWEQEYEADELASELMFGILHQQDAESNRHGKMVLYAPAFSIAPILFFLIEELVDTVAQVLLDNASISYLSTHPPAHFRLEAVLESRFMVAQVALQVSGNGGEMARVLSDFNLDPAKWCVEWFSEIKKTMEEHLHSMNFDQIK